MAEIPHKADAPVLSDGKDKVSGINLVDLAQAGQIGKDAQPKTQPVRLDSNIATFTLPPATHDIWHVKRPEQDADLNRIYSPANSGEWHSDAPLREYYEDGLLKLRVDPNGREQLGVRLSEPKTDRTPIPMVPIGKQHLNDKGIALELRLKF